MPVHYIFTSDPSKLTIARTLGIASNDDGTFSFDLDSIKSIDTILIASRLHCLSKDELYFLQNPEELLYPLNHRNEAAAISLLLQSIAHQSDDNTSLKGLLARHCQDLWPAFKHGDTILRDIHIISTTNHPRDIQQKQHTEPQPEPRPEPQPEPRPCPAAAPFHAWAKQHDIHSLIEMSNFEGVRGCAAMRNISAGEHILSIPRKMLIYDETVLETDLGRMLKVLPGLSMDNLLIIWTMIDRFDPDSLWFTFWNSLPEAYFTGLTFPGHVVEYLRGTAAYLELQRAQNHLQNQYQATKVFLDILLQAYPQHLTEEMFTFANYMWAVELFYSYAFEIEFPPNKKSKTVMVPFACMVNHSPWPHVVRYGKLNVSADTLDFPAFRPCQQNQQVFISYGPVPNLKLLCYYGFSLLSNPHDLVPLTLEEPDGGLRPLQKKALDKVFSFGDCIAPIDADGHKIAQQAFMEHSLRDGPISKKLLACIRIIVATDEELEGVLRENSRNDVALVGPISVANEVQTRQTLQCMIKDLVEPVENRIVELRSILCGSMENRDDGVQSNNNENGFDSEWRMSCKFCLVYLEGQKKILNRAMQECSSM